MLLDTPYSSKDVSKLGDRVLAIGTGKCIEEKCNCSCLIYSIVNFHVPQEWYYFGTHFFKIFVVFVEFLYLLVYLKPNKRVKKIKSSFFDMVLVFCIFFALRAAVSSGTFFFVHFYGQKHFGIYLKMPANIDKLLQVPMYFDWIGEFFLSVLLFAMALHRCLAFKNEVLDERIFERSRIFFLITLFLMFSTISGMFLIHTSDLQRLFVQSIGFVDSGVPGYQILISRLFYIFPIGSIICYVILYSHIRSVTRQTMLSRTTQSGEQKVFLQLFITILFYGAMCIVFEYISTKKKWTKDPTEKFNLVAVLNILNYLPEISLPLMLLVSNSDLKRRISTFLGKESNRSVTVSVAPT